MAIDDNISYELFGYQVKDLATKINSKAEASSLATVATSGLYTDLIGAPTIPTVYNGALTITQGGTTLGTFTANSSTNETIDIPTGGSTYTAGEGIDITNDEISIADNSVTATKLNLSTIVSAGVWTTTANLPSVASTTYQTIDVSSLGFSSANDYAVMAFNIGGGSNGPFVMITIDPKTATSFTLRVWNAHWGGGAVGAGVKVQWFVIKVA